MARTYGRIYFESGELYFEGWYETNDSDLEGNTWIQEKLNSDGIPYKTMVLKYEGTEYYKNGNKRRDGIFQHGGLSRGKEYYVSGKLKFEGVYNDKRGTSYYGPSYPVNGSFYSETGELLYLGKFTIRGQGSLGYPKVVFPEGFGTL